MFSKKNICVFVIITIIALIIRILLIEHKSSDYELFLSSWFNDIKNNGGLTGLDSYDGNYNYPYVTIIALLTYLPISPLFSIKILSIVFDFLLAIIGIFIIKELLKNKNEEKKSIVQCQQLKEDESLLLVC